MNYYPNYYAGYPYNIQVPPQQTQPQVQQQSQLQQMFQQPMLNGKIVDSADIVKVTEVPVGGYGVFPRADMGEIYIKTWGQDGTTQITTYRPVPPPQPAAPAPNLNEQVLERLGALESKIDNIMNAAIAAQQQPASSLKEEKQDESTRTINSAVASKF